MNNDPLSAAKNLRELIIEHRDETESQRQLAAPIVEALIDTNLCRMALSVDDGGLETSPVDALAVYETLAAAEASVAWVAWNNSLVCWFARHLSPGVREEVFGDPSALFASSTRPSGRAVPQGSDYVVNGRWALVSGCMHAHWIPVMAFVEEDGEIQMLDGGVPNMRLFMAPRGSYEILDTWHVGGLRGTGSHDAVLKDEFVPEGRSFSPMGPSLIDTPLGRVPVVVTMAAGCAAICLGIAQSAADSLVELGVTKVPVDPGPSLRNRPQNQATVARTQTLLEALRANLRSGMAALWGKAEANESPTPADLARVWSASVTTALECRELVTASYAAAGTSSLYVDNSIERGHRDIHAVLQHIVLQPFWLEEAGRVALGLEPAHPLFAI